MSEMNRQGEACECGTSTAHRRVPGCTPPHHAMGYVVGTCLDCGGRVDSREEHIHRRPSSVAMLGEAVAASERSLCLAKEAGALGSTLVILENAVRAARTALEAAERAETRQRYAEKHRAQVETPTILGAPVTLDLSVPEGHVDVVRRDGMRVRFDLRTAAERMEAEAKRGQG